MVLLLLQNLLAENGDEEEEQQKEDVEDVRVVMRAFDDALFIVDMEKRNCNVVDSGTC